MNPQSYASQPPKRKSEGHREAKGVERSHAEAHTVEAQAKAEQAARSVMHPESFDPDWRYYHGAMGG